MSGVYRRCRGCRLYRPARELRKSVNGSGQFQADFDLCRVCYPPVATKPCRACGITKPITEFHVNRGGKDGRHANCDECRNAKNREMWREKEHNNKENRRGSSLAFQHLIVGRWTKDGSGSV